MQDESKMERVSTGELVEVLRGRTQFYLMLAGLYYKPLTQEQIDHMAEQNFSGFDTDEELLDAGFNDIRRSLRKRHTGTRSILATEWTGIFGGAESYEGHYCVPEASLFLDDSGLTYGWPRDEVSRVYREQCLRLEDNAGLPESHLSFELEFLAIMSEEIAQHLIAGETEDAVRKVELSQRFIEQHVLTWLSKLYELAMKMFRTRFYRGVMRVTLGYLQFELKMLGDIKVEVQEA